MSVFSKIKLSRKAAKDRKVKAADKDKDGNEVVKIPYRHVPTHAAVDALSGAPSSWKVEDRSKIKEHHQRRSQMVISRTGSSLSTMSYMNAAAGPSSQAPPLPRTSSYSSYNPTWFDRGGDIYYTSGEQPSQKRYKPSRGHSYHDSGIGPSVGPSPLASNINSEEVSPVVSSGNSTTSNSSDNLEIAVTPNPNRMSQRPQPIVYEEKDIFDRLHTSTTRKLGEAPLYNSPHYNTVVVKGPMATTTVAAHDSKPKKQRWSLLGKKNAATIAV